MTSAPLTEATASRPRRRAAWSGLLGTRTGGLRADAALVAVRTALAWIFIYHGAGKLFGAFNGPGLHRTALYFANVAHLHPGGLFAVLGGITEFAGGIALALGAGSRLAGLALFGDMVIAMITVSWVNGVNSETPHPGYELNMALAVLGLVVVFFGAGRISIDAVVSRYLTGRARHPQPRPAATVTR